MENRQMFAYKIEMVNEDNCEKPVYVTANSFLKAVNKMRKEQGGGWSVYSYSMVHADY